MYVHFLYVIRLFLNLKKRFISTKNNIYQKKKATIAFFCLAFGIGIHKQMGYGE